MDTIKFDAKNTLMVAHRGVSGLEKENTNLAFTVAGNRTYFGVETDVHRTKDGKFILIHDNDTNRVTAEKYIVEETDYNTLRSIRIYDKDGTNTREDLRMPALEEYIKICKKYEKFCVLELKSDFNKQEVQEIIDLFNKENYLEKVIFISFILQPLVYVRELLPEQPIQYLTCAINPEVIEKLKTYHFDLDVQFPALTEENIKELHAYGVKINCWTVNDKEVAEKLVSWGVDYITTNILENQS